MDAPKEAPATAVAWDARRHALGVPDMDATHREFLEAVGAMLRAPAADLGVLFLEALAHTERHFENESRLMRACSSSAQAEHEGEHARVLVEMRHFAAGLQRGRLAPVRAYVRSLPDWFAQHVATMDAALAGCIKRAGTSPAQG